MFKDWIWKTDMEAKKTSGLGLHPELSDSVVLNALRGLSTWESFLLK